MPKSATFEITWDTRQMERRSTHLKQQFPRYLDAVMERGAVQTQSEARANARWTDQTGNARQGLFGKRFNTDKTVGIVLYHSVPYGIWLEVRFSGKYAIIPPTIQKMGPQVMQDVRTLLRALN